jgi:hypothetical protein
VRWFITVRASKIAIDQKQDPQLLRHQVASEARSPPDPGTAGKGFPRSFWGTLFLSVTAALICYYVHRRASPPRGQVISPFLLLERLPVREVGRPKRLTSWNGRGSSVSSWGALLTNRALLLQEAPGQFRTYSPVLLEWHAEGPSSVGLASG